jgi:hypothetical protein
VLALPGKLCLPPLKLLDYDRGVLVSKVALLLNQISHCSLGALPSNDAIEPCESSFRQPNFSFRHPRVQMSSVRFELRNLFFQPHVQNYRLFIIFEQVFLLNTTHSPLESCVPVSHCLALGCALS